MTAQRFEILLVDDTASDARLFEMALNEVAPRATLYWVATGEEALEALQRRNRFQDVLGIGIVVMDLNMPRGGGLETLSRIKSDAALKQHPVLILTNSRNEADIEECYRLGANSYFVKPMTFAGMRELVACIARYWLEFAALPNRGENVPSTSE